MSTPDWDTLPLLTGFGGDSHGEMHGRTLLLQENVQAYGAAGDGVTDDTDAIQAALDVAQASNGTGVCYFPPGSYKITGPLTIDGYGCRITGPVGTNPASSGGWEQAGARIFGDFNDFMFKKSTASNQYMYVFEHLGFENLHATGGCLSLNKLQAPSGIYGCFFIGHKGIYSEENTFNVKIQNCTFQRSPTNYVGSRAISLSGHFHVQDVDITSYEQGITCGGPVNYIMGARIENCGHGLHLGSTADGTTNTWGGMVAGVSMEANDYGVWLQKAQGVLIGVGVLGSPSFAPNGGTFDAASVTAWYVNESVDGLTLISCGSAGTHTNHMHIQGTPDPMTVIGFRAAGTGSLSMADITDVQFINCIGITNTPRLPVIATASLPAAAAQQNGRAVIEDAGAGDRNLIIYAGAERFRIDGGAAF